MKAENDIETQIPTQTYTWRFAHSWRHRLWCGQLPIFWPLHGTLRYFDLNSAPRYIPHIFLTYKPFLTASFWSPFVFACSLSLSLSTCLIFIYLSICIPSTVQPSLNIVVIEFKVFSSFSEHLQHLISVYPFRIMGWFYR